MARSIAENKPVIAVSLDRDIGKIKSDVMKILGNIKDPEESGLLKFIDAYSRTVQLQSPSKHAIVSDGIANYSLFIKTLDSAAAGILETMGSYSFVFFSLTGMISQIDPKFFLSLILLKKLSNALSTLCTTSCMARECIFLYSGNIFFISGISFCCDL